MDGRLSYLYVEPSIKSASMISGDRIMTKHPQGKKGVNLMIDKYEVIKDFILDTIKEHGEIGFKELSDLAIVQLTGSFEGKVLWYVVTVKLDLEARQFIERVPKTSPHRLRLSR